MGRVTVRALVEADHDVVILDTAPPIEDVPPGASFAEVSAADYAAVRTVCVGADAIVHLAGIPKPGDHAPHVIHNTNVVASYNALSVAVELGIPRVVMASSVNAVGLTWSREPTFDYFPIDEQHATRNEDPYSLSKWLGEQQADSIVRLNSGVSVASLRLHMFMENQETAARFSVGEWAADARRGLWGYTTHQMWIDACLGALTAGFSGHERFFIVADRNAVRGSSRSLAHDNFPHVVVRETLDGDAGFFDCTNARALLGWSGHD